jgi:hypothetical protein
MSSTSVAAAKKFLIGRILDRALRDEIVLSTQETQALGFCELNATAEEIEAAKAFDAENDTDRFEAKIAGLIRRAYAHDELQGKVSEWDRSLEALAGGDIYILVMVDQSGIRKSFPFSFILDWFRILPIRQVAAAIAIVIVGIIIGFTSAGVKLFPNDFARLGVLLLLLAIFWLISVRNWRRT